MAGATLYRTETEIEDVVKRFEECSFTPEEFVHARHLTVASVYFFRFDANVAKERMRKGLRKFIKHHGKDGYHVTITEFWLGIVEGAVRGERNNQTDLVSMVNDLAGPRHQKNMVYEYYSRERLSSPAAKTEWIKPDLKSMPSEK